MYDVLVVGGGPAGCATAIHLARRGRRVVLIERTNEPQRKACGEGLFPVGVAELERLGVLDEVRIGSAEIDGLRFHAGGNVAEARLGLDRHGALATRRGALEGVLAEAATRAGVEIKRGLVVESFLVSNGRVAGVHLRGSTETVAARVIVGADGLHSRVRALVGLDGSRRGNRYGVSAHVRMGGGPRRFVEVYFERGYELYLTPAGDGIVNVAVLLRKPAMRQFAGRLNEGFAEFLSGHRAIESGFEIVDAPLAAGPFAATARRSWRANVLLVGDAAGFFDGISGEGMALALRTGGLAAEAIGEHLVSGSHEPFRAYERVQRAMRRNSGLLARMSLLLGHNERVARFAVGRLASNPGAFTSLTAISGGERGWGSLRPRDIAGLLLGF